MTQPENKLTPPTEAATVVNVSHVHGEGTNRNALTPTQHDDHVSNSEVVIQAPRADHEIYYYQLLTKKRGYPLWIPGPGMQLPIEYRRQGISIGDVGIITHSGGFDFLFNIFQPADHPIHRRGVPESFSSLDITQLEIETNRIYGRNTYLTSSPVRTAGTNSSDLIFESTAREAAILTMPKGALTQNLLNGQVIRKYIAINARSWFEYARDTRGRIVENGDIRVVVGCDKVCSWGIATSTSTSGQSVSLAFKVDDKAGTYRWDCIGSGSGRVGPQGDDIADLKQGGAAPQNQCVFVRTMNFTLAGDIIGGDYSAPVVLPGPVTSKANKENPRGSASANSDAREQHSSASRLSSRRSVQGGLHPRQFGTFDTKEHGIVHPTASLHERFLDRFPNATMIITQDADWISVLTDEDTGLPGPEELYARISGSHEVYESDGIVTLRKKPVYPHKRSTTISAADPQRCAQGGSRGNHNPKRVVPPYIRSNSAQGGLRDRIDSIPDPYRSAQGGSKVECSSGGVASSHSQSSSVQGDPRLYQSAVLDIWRSFQMAKESTSLCKPEDRAPLSESHKNPADTNISVSQHNSTVMVATASHDHNVEEKPSRGVNDLLLRQPSNIANVTENFQNTSSSSRSGASGSDDTLSWTNQDCRESVLFTRWGILYRFETDVTPRGQTVTSMFRYPRPNREDCIARLVWAPNGGLGRASIGKQVLSMVDLTKADPRIPGARNFTGPDGYTYQWRPFTIGMDIVLQDPTGEIIAAFRPTRPTRYQIGDVHGELQFFRNAGNGTVLYPPMQDMVTLTAMLYRFCTQFNL